jgi:hypothetical protein
MIKTTWDTSTVQEMERHVSCGEKPRHTTIKSKIIAGLLQVI